MKALSIRQPWAWLIINAGKDVENRSRRSSYRGPLLIHASATMTKADYEACVLFIAGIPRNGNWRLPAYDVVRQQCGGIVGRVTMVGCLIASDSKWFVGDYGYKLTDPQPLPFTPWKGQWNFFEVNLCRHPVLNRRGGPSF